MYYKAEKKVRSTLELEGILYKLNPGKLTPADDQSEVVPVSTSDENGLEGAVYAELEKNLSEKIKLIGGLRFSGFAALGPKQVYLYQDPVIRKPDEVIDSIFFADGEIIKFYPGFEPRIALQYQLNKESSLKVSYDRIYQFMALISNTISPTPIDLWKLADYHFKPQSADSYSVGYFRNFDSNNWETSVEVYYKDLDHIIEYKDFPDLVANEHIETELLEGIGRNYGTEVSIKKNQGKWSGRISYTYSRSERKVDTGNPEYDINHGEWFPSNFDKPHDFNLLINHNITKRVSLNCNFVYNTGQPVTIPLSNYRDWFVPGVPVYSERNEYRIPDYHRLDLSLTIAPGYKKDKKVLSSWTLSVYNVYGRKNAYSIYFNQKPFQRLRAYRLSVLGSVFPSITYNFQLR